MSVPTDQAGPAQTANKQQAATPDELARSCWALAHHLAYRSARRNPWADADELVSAALLGLARAVKEYRPERGKFTTFCHGVIRHALAQEVQKQWAAPRPYQLIQQRGLRRCEWGEGQPGFSEPAVLADRRAGPVQQLIDAERPDSGEVWDLLDGQERRVVTALLATRGNVRDAARRLGMSRRGVQRLIVPLRAYLRQRGLAGVYNRQG